MPHILSFDAHSAEAARHIGGKGLNLCRLRRSGFRVPAGFCVSVSAFDEMLAANPVLSAVIDGWFAGQGSREAVRAAWEAAAWPEALSQELDRAAAALDPAEPLAVRSSAIVEDSAQFSFAGQFDTKLGIAGGEALRRALKACWASLCSETLRQHANDHGLGRHDLKMAVVVQTMIRPRVAGVLFTVDPMGQDRARLRIESSYGLGEALVSGDITPDSFVVDKASGAAVAQEIAHKASHLRYEGGAVVDGPVAEGLRDAPSLSVADIAKLTREARRIEAWAGKPQDIEWAFDGETLYILQSRDITTLGDIDSTLFTPQTIAGSWTRENMAERFYKVNTPFTISTLYPALEKGIEATFNRVGIQVDQSFGPLVRVFYGRPYLNKAAVADALRGIKVDNTQMEAVLGRRENMGFNPRLPLIAIGVLRMIARSFEDWKAFQREVLDPLVIPSEAELAARTLPQLRHSLDAQLRIFERYWVVHMINVRCADFCQKIIRMLLGSVHATQEEAFAAFCRLSAGFAENITSDSDAELHRISRRILEKPHLAKTLRSGSHAAFRQALAADPAGPKIAARFERFIEQFGNKLVHQEFHDHQWRDDPEGVWQHIAAAMTGEDEDPKVRVMKKAKERKQAYAATLARFKGPLGWVLRPVFEFIYRKMCDYIPARENDQFHFGKLVYVMRRTVLHMGKRLVARGVLAAEDDIFFVELGKIPASAEGAADLKDYVARQRALFARYETMDIPHDINGGARLAQAVGAQAGWTGYGVSSGTVTATASVAHEPSELDAVGHGHVLVTHSTNPAWTPAFGRIAALVTESGGMLSHGAIMAREYGIPAVLGVRGATSLIASGDSITVNGAEGRVSPGKSRKVEDKMNLANELELPCGARLKNRVVKTATSEGLADRHDHATQGHARLYETWARGGAGLLVTGNVMVDRRHLERPGNVVLEDASGMRTLGAWAAAGSRENTHLWMQLSHPGRQCPKLVSKEPLAPSAVQLHLLGNFAKPRAMTEEDIADVIERFGKSAALAQQAGFTGVQVNAAHGYLVSQFLSPKVNQRDDRWGGSLANRARLLLAVVARIRQEVGAQFPISVKLNAADFQRGGFELGDSCQCALWLADAGVDLLEVSGGNFEHLRLLGDRGDPKNAQDPEVAPGEVKGGYFTDYALAIAQALEGAGKAMPLMVTGGFRTREAMERVLALGSIALVGLARPFCATPDLAHRLLRGEDVPADPRGSLQAGGALHRWLLRFKIYRVLRVQSEVAWHARQLAKLAQGAGPERASLPRALVGHMSADMAHAMRRKPPVAVMANQAA